ncbi:hypothetical protein V8C86DRAFT_719334 [Haematococcus lacustris]
MLTYLGTLLTLAASWLAVCHAGDATGSGFPFFDNCRRSLSETRFDLRFVRETVDPVQGSVFCWAVFVKPASTCSSPRRRCCDTTFSKVKLYTNPECNRSFDTMRVTSPLANVNFTVSVSQDNVCSARSETSCVKFTQFRAFGVSEANGTTLCIRMRPSSGGNCSTLQQITNPVLAGRSLFELGLYDVKVDNYECCPTFAYNLAGDFPLPPVPPSPPPRTATPPNLVPVSVSPPQPSSPPPSFAPTQPTSSQSPAIPSKKGASCTSPRPTPPTSTPPKASSPASPSSFLEACL